MGKTELVEKIAAEAGISKSAASQAFDALIEGIVDAVKSGERVGLIGFGTFSVVDRAARMGKNPQTGAPIEIPAKRVLKFKPSATLKMESE